MSEPKSALFLERFTLSEGGIISFGSVFMFTCIRFLGLRWAGLVFQIDRLIRQMMVAWLRRRESPVVRSTSGAVVATSQQAGSVKQRLVSAKQRARSAKQQHSRSTKQQQSRSTKQQAAPLNPIEATSPPSKSIALVIEVLEKAKVDERNLSLTNQLLRLWLAKAIEFPTDCMVICPPAFGCFYTVSPHLMESSADHYTALCFGVFGVSEAMPMYMKLILMNVIVFVSGVVILEAAQGLVAGTALLLLWSWYGTLWVVTAIRRISVVHLLEDNLRLRSEFASLKHEHDKCTDELETLEQYKLQRQCKLCYSVDATSIVMDCGHVDLCEHCVCKLEGSNHVLWSDGECPEYEKPCLLSGKGAHVHCLICRGGGMRRKVFFA